MKKILILFSIFSLLNISSSVAQLSGLEGFKNKIETGVGLGFMGSGDVIGIMQYTQYSREILPYMELGAGFSLGHLSSNREFSFVQMAPKTLDLNISLIPIRSNRQRLIIGTGISLRNSTNIFGYSTNGREGNTTNYESSHRQEYNSIGLTVLMEYEYHFLDRWIIGSRASYQYYIMGSPNVLFLGINGGIRF